MHIVHIYHEKVPVKNYGGIERIIEALCLGQRKMGHKITLISFKGDYPINGIDFLDLDRFGSKASANTEYISLIPKDADVLHFHVPFSQDQTELPAPYVCTLHGNLTEDEDISSLPKNTVFISKNHMERHQGKHFVYNGLMTKSIPFNDSPSSQRNNFSFLGRASLKRKGVHLAKVIAKKFKTPLHIGGGRGFSLGNNKYKGHLNDMQKFDLLKNSKALLFPILWEEPFGLVMIEAMFTGTPVFALRRGSVPEILENEESKQFCLVADTTEELIEKISTYKFDYNPLAIRSYAERFFSHNSMCKGYLEKYEHVIAGESLIN